MVASDNTSISRLPEGVTTLEQAQAIHHEEWRREILMQEELFMKLYSHLPKELIFQRELLTARL